MKRYSIAVDGPSGAGKSSISQEISKRLGILHLDTGAIYRAIGLYCIEKGIADDDEAEIEKHLGDIDLEVTFEDGEQHIYIGDRDVTGLIRTPEVSEYASAVSAFSSVRARLLEIQRDIATHTSVIMDGRDIGTVVLPGADVKIFLSATPEDRARRRHEELVESGLEVDYGGILKATVERDHRDTTRANSPLRPAEDAIQVDTTGFPIEKSIALIEKLIRERLENVF